MSDKKIVCAHCGAMELDWAGFGDATDKGGEMFFDCGKCEKQTRIAFAILEIEKH